MKDDHVAVVTRCQKPTWLRQAQTSPQLRLQRPVPTCPTASHSALQCSLQHQSHTHTVVEHMVLCSCIAARGTNHAHDAVERSVLWSRACSMTYT